MVANLERTFSRLGTFDLDAVNSVPLRAAKPWMDNPFTDYEISAAVRKLGNGKSAGEAQCPVIRHFCRAVLSRGRALMTLKGSDTLSGMLPN